MKKNNKGFTLVELLAVIVVLAIIITIASGSVLSILNNSKQRTANEMRESVKDSAISYVTEKFYLEKCSATFSQEISSGNLSHVTENSACTKKFTIATLKAEGFFEDNHKYCNEEQEIIVYRFLEYNVDEITGERYENSEYRAYIDENACTN